MVLPTDLAGAAGRALDWRRPHPITIVVEIGRAIRSVIVALVIVSGGLLDQSTFLELALVATPLLGGLARWYTTRYALDDESVHHHHGLIWRKKQVLPRSNVQNVSTKAGLLARMASVVEMQISDASATGDIGLRYVTQSEADRLATLLRTTSAQFVPDDGPTAPPPPADTALDGPDPAPTGPGSITAGPPPTGQAVASSPLVSPTIGELARTELTSASTVGAVMFAAGAAVVGTTIVALEPVPIPDDAGRGPWIAVLVAVVFPILATIIGFASRLLVLGGYRLQAEPDRLRIQAGLVTEARITARRERIQQIRVIRDLTHQRLGIERVTFETADVEAQGTAGTGYLSPTSPAGSWRALAAEAFGEVQLDEGDLSPVSPLTTRRMLVRFAAAAVLLAALALIAPGLGIVAVAGCIGLGVWFSRRRYRELGWAVSEDQFLVRSGVFHGRLTLVRLDKVQTVGLVSTLFQRRLGLATLRVSTAGRGFGGLVTLPDLPSPLAEQLRSRLAHRSASTPIADTL